MVVSVTHATPSGGEVNQDDYEAEHVVSGVAAASHTHDGGDISTGTVADARIASTLTRDSEAASAYSAIGHDHDGTPDAQLAQANTHQSPDTDSGTSSLHHTIGTGANQAAAGNHNHVLSALTAPAADVSMNSHKITNVTDPGSNQDAATKKYVDDSVAAGVTFGTPVKTGTANSAGSGTTAARANHVHQSAGEEFDYAAFTSAVSITATTEGTSNTVIAGNSVAYDGSTVVNIEFFSPGIAVQASAGAFCSILLYEDSTLLGIIAQARTPAAGNNIFPCFAVFPHRTPSNASHTYTVKALTSSGTSTVNAGTGGTGQNTAGYLRVVKV